MRLTKMAGSLACVAVLAACGTDAPGAGERVFEEGVGEDECRVLTTADVAAATGVPADQITQRAISGCLYSWEDGSIALLGIRVHDSVDRAKSYFARFTEDATAEEVSAAKGRVKEELADREAADEGAAGRALTDAMPEEDISHRALSGIGSEAAMDGRGSVRIRYGNLTVWFTGKTNGQDRIDPEVASAIGRRIVGNLDGM